MLEANMSGFPKFIFLLFLIYIVFRLIFGFYGAQIFQFVLKKIFKRSAQKFGDFQADNPQNKTGKTTIIDKGTPHKQSNKDVGEYIDFEEID